MAGGLRSAIRILSAEFFATLFLIFFGCGAIIASQKAANDDVNSVPVVQVALAFGFTYGSVIFVFSHLSGAIVNPALVLALAVTRKLPLVQALFYIGVEIVGAIAGAAILDSVTGRTEFDQLGSTILQPGVTQGEGFGMELIITFMYILVVFAVGDPDRIAAGSLREKSIQIAFVAVVLNFVALPYTGASFNPARSFGPAVVSGVWTNHWVYWLGPFAGATLAALLYELWLNPKVVDAASSADPKSGNRGVNAVSVESPV